MKTETQHTTSNMDWYYLVPGGNIDLYKDKDFGFNKMHNICEGLEKLLQKLLAFANRRSKLARI